MEDLLKHIKQRLEVYLAKELDLKPGPLEVIPSSRDNYVFSDKSNSFIIRVSLNKSSSDVGSEVELLKYLKGHNFSVPEVVSSSFIEIKGRKYPFVIFEYINHLQKPPLGKEQVSLAARYLGNLHNLTAIYCQEVRFRQNRTLDRALLQLSQNITGSSTAINKNQVLEDLAWGINFYKSRDDTNIKLILHNDYRINNVLFATPSKVACVIDFDWSVESSFALKDLGHAALEWSYPDNSKFNRELYDYFIEQYWKSETPVKKVSHPEIWLWSRFSALTDAAYYFLSFPERSTDKFESYMYDKYLFFKDNEA